jgi:hypothetical protein
MSIDISKIVDVKPIDTKLFKDRDKDYLDSIKPINYNDLYTYAGNMLGYVSKFDEYNPLTNTEGKYAEKQGLIGTVGNAIGGAAVLAGTTFVNHYAGYGRDINAAMSMDYKKLWNDELGSTASYIMRAVPDLFPVYETEEQQRMRDADGGAANSFSQYIPFTGRAGKAWANMAQQFGFTIGTIGAIGLEEVALGALTAESGGAAAPVAAAKTAWNIKKLLNIRSLYNMLKEGRALNNINNVAKATNTLTKVVRSKPVELYRMVAAAKGEAAIEANFAALEYKEDQIQKYIELNGTYPPADFLDELESNAVGVGNTTFNVNTAVLMTSNYLAMRNLFKPSNLSTARFIDDFARKDIVKGLADKNLAKGAVIDGILKGSPKLQKAWSITSKVGKLTGIENLSEGFEEVAQGFGSGAAKRQFDMFNSEYGRGMSAFFLAVGDEIAEKAGTKEMWDEFAAGFMTGFGIQGGKAAFNKIRGIDKRKTEVVTNAINQVVSANSAYTNAISQSLLADKIESATAENNIKEAKNLKKEAEDQLFITLEKNGIAKEYFENIGENLKETLQEEAKNILQDRGVDDIVSELKRKYDTFEQELNKQRKRVGNPYSEREKGYQIWDAALALSVTLQTSHLDMVERASKLRTEIENKFGVDSIFLEGIVDPYSTIENKRLLKQDLEMAKSRLSLETISETEKQRTQEDISKIEQRLNILNAINERYFDEQGEIKEGLQGEQSITEILRGVLNNASNQEEAKQLLEDMESLEREGSKYLQMYNMLSNKDMFNKYGSAFVGTWFDGMKQVENKVADEEIEPQIISEDEQVTNEEVEELIKDKSTGEIQGIRQEVEDLVETDKIVRNSDNTFKYKGKDYENVNDLFEDIKKDNNFDKDALNTDFNGETLDTLIKKRLNSLKPNQEEDAQEKNKKVEKDKKVTKKEPKTKKADEKEIFSFIQNSGQTLTHYFDIVLGATWDSFNYTMQKLRLNGKDTTINKIEDARVVVGVNSTLSNIYLASKEQIEDLLGDSIENFNKNNTDIQVVYDGIRLFILTAGNVKEASTIIKDVLGINIPTNGKIVSLENEKGQAIESGFRATIGLNAVTDEAVFNVKKGDNVNLMVLDNEFNRNLLESGKTEEEKIDQLIIGVYNVKDELVGILRAGDFLYEQNVKKVKEYRQKIAGAVLKKGSNPIGALIGTTTVGGITTARNYNLVDGKKQYKTAGEFSPVGYDKEYYYVNNDGVIINEKGDIVENAEELIERSNLAFNAVYIKIKSKSGAKQMTSQLVREGNSKFTEKEFKDRKYETEGLTGLKEETPIVSRRIIIDMNKLEEDEATTENNKEEIKEAVNDIVQSTSTTTQSGIEETINDTITQQNDTKPTLTTILTNINEFINENKEEPLKGLFRGKLIDELIKLYQEVSNEKNLKGDKLKQELRLELKDLLSEEEIEEFEESGYIDKIKPQKNKVVVEDKGGNKVVLSDVKIEGDNLTAAEDIIIPIVEIHSVSEEQIDEQINETNSEEWDNLIVEEKWEEQPKWLFNNARIGEVYQLGGSTIKIVNKEADKLTIEEDGLLLNIDEEGNITKDYGSESTTTTYEIGEINTFITTLVNNINSFGVDGQVVLNKLIKVFKNSYIQGEVITDIEQLIEEADLTLNEYEALSSNLTPVFQVYLFQMLLNAESVWDTNADNRWEEFSTSLTDTADFLESVFSDGVPLMEYRKALKDEEKKLEKVFKKTGIKINFGSLYNFRPEDLRLLGKNLKEALSLTNLKERWDSFIKVITKAGLELEYSGVEFLQKIDKKSISRNPHINLEVGISADIAMMSYNGKNFVRNESDGTFIELPYKKQDNSVEILKVQEYLLSLLNINFPLGYLQNYLKINKSFDKLRERAIQNANSVVRQVNDDFSVIEEAKEKNKMIISKVSSSLVEYKGKTYIPIMTSSGGNTIYAEQGAKITPTQIRDIMKEENIVKNTRKRIISFGNRTKNLRKLKSEIENLTCRI